MRECKSNGMLSLCMQYHQLGKSGLHVSAISFGCMSLGRQQAENTKLIDHAIDLGINLFDTADIYDKGWNEETVGNAVKSKRNNILLATKAGNVWKQDDSGLLWNATKKHILTAVESSLQRLQTDRIDLYQLHGGMMTDDIDEVIETFNLLKQQGKIRAYGISSIRPNVIREYAKRSDIADVMMQYSLLDRRPEETCLSLLHEQQIGVLARGSLAQGLLVNKPAKPYLANGTEDVAAIAAAVKKLSGNERSPAQTALQFVLQNKAISSIVAGIHTVEQLKEITGAIHCPKLTQTELDELNGIARPFTYTDHR